jgi:thioesterase domain-containing protein
MAGLIAFEIAQQLETQGETTAFLGLVDSCPFLLPWRIYLPIRMPFFVRRMRFHTSELIKGDGGDRAEYFARRFASLRSLLQHNTQDGVPGEKLEKWKRGSPKGDYFAMLGAHYRPKPYRGDACLFLAEKAEVNPVGAWRWLVKGKLTLQRVPGSHLGIMSPENLETFASIFKKHLVAAQSRQHSSGG